MDEILRICGIALIGIVMATLLRNRGSAIAPYITQVTALIIFSTAVAALIPVIEFIKSMTEGQAEASDAISSVLLASVIAVVFRILSDICKENGENMLKNAVEFAGNAEIILLCLPIIKDIITISSEILEL